MPIKSFTGLPGHGKTSLMVERLLQEAKKAERPLWAAGIDGLRPGIASILKDPREWNAVKPGMTCTCHDTEDSSACDAHVVPNGSLIFVDEAWKWFGHLQNAGRQTTPQHVLDLAEHRHRGIDFFWTYQQPCQIYPFARGLCDEHWHVVRRFGTQIIEVIKWEELNEDVKSSAKREQAVRQTRTLPQDAWQAYKSAEVHTIKRRIPFRVFALPLLLVAVVGLGYLTFHLLRSPAAASETEPGAASAASAPGSAPDGTREEKPMTVAEYAKAHTPRFPSMPHTAPIWDDRAPQSDPLVMCMASEAGEDVDGRHRDASCLCLTEQGTAYDIHYEECRRLARHGPAYNPYRERSESRGDLGEREPVGQATQTASPGVVMHAPQVSGYGDLPRAERVETASDNGFSGG